MALPQDMGLTNIPHTMTSEFAHKSVHYLTLFRSVLRPCINRVPVHRVFRLASYACLPTSVKTHSLHSTAKPGHQTGEGDVLGDFIVRNQHVAPRLSIVGRRIV